MIHRRFLPPAQLEASVLQATDQPVRPRPPPIQYLAPLPMRLSFTTPALARLAEHISARHAAPTSAPQTQLTNASGPGDLDTAHISVEA